MTSLILLLLVNLCFFFLAILCLFSFILEMINYWLCLTSTWYWVEVESSHQITISVWMDNSLAMLLSKIKFCILITLYDEETGQVLGLFLMSSCSMLLNCSSPTMKYYILSKLFQLFVSWWRIELKKVISKVKRIEKYISLRLSYHMKTLRSFWKSFCLHWNMTTPCITGDVSEESSLQRITLYSISIYTSDIWVKFFQLWLKLKQPPLGSELLSLLKLFFGSI